LLYVRVAMKYSTASLFFLILIPSHTIGSDGDILLALLKATKRDKAQPTAVSKSRYPLALFKVGMGTLLTGMGVLGYVHIKDQLVQDRYTPEDDLVFPVPQVLHQILYQLLLECGFSEQEANAVELCVQILPKNIYGYADYSHNRIVLNTQWCMLADFYTNRFDKLWSTLLSWWITPGLKFIFCHEALHLKQHAQVPYKSDQTHMRSVTLFCEMEADLGALDILLKHAHWGAVVVSMSKITFDALRSVSYGSWAPSAYERYRCWKQFCIDYIMKREPSYQEYANNYIEELED
jgi:hypothetical protein